MSKSSTVTTNFDHIEVRDVKYMPLSYNNDILFMLLPISMGIVYDCSIDGMEKMCDRHAWCTTKTIPIQNDLDTLSCVFLCVNHLQCPNDF